jgi:hypothetical protein
VVESFGLRAANTFVKIIERSGGSRHQISSRLQPIGLASEAALHVTLYPRPTNGIFVAITVMN